AATYRRARFDMQPIATRGDSLVLVLGPFASLFGGGDIGVSNNTIVIKGNIWKDGIEMPFTYSSKITGSESVFFDKPLVVPAGGTPMEVLVHFETAAAFSDQSGLLLDPRDPRNST